MIEIDAPAKINPILEVGDRAPDGYHPIRTLFYALELADRVIIERREAEPGVQLSLVRDDPGRRELGPASQNLAVLAAQAFLSAAGVRDSVRIRLEKRIPAGAGLGGGSSDAAAVLRGLASMYPDKLPSNRLAELGLALGSDVPFFLEESAMAWGEGKGERLTLLPPLPPRPVLLVVPPFPVSTAAAYGWLDEHRVLAPGSDEGEHRFTGRTSGPPEISDWRVLGDRAKNDFEPVIFRRHPVLERVREALVAAGASVALLAGSGSTLFGVFENAGRLETAREVIGDVAPDAACLPTVTRS